MLQLLDVGSLMTCPDLVLWQRPAALTATSNHRPGKYDAAISVQAGYNRNRNARKVIKKENRDLESRLEHIKQCINLCWRFSFSALEVFSAQ